MAIPIYTPGGSGVTQTVTNFENQSVVSINHSLSYRPRVLITDTTGNMIMGDVVFTTGNVTITFVSNISGTVYLS
tara:strand:+ start:183 stop:407 length:225 start_codon:yes stop_codon:yes gene_type:complete